MPGKWFEARAGQVGSVREPPIDETTKAKCGRDDREEESFKGAGHVGVCDGLPQAGSLTDGGDQLDGGAGQGDRSPGSQDKRGGGEGGGGAGGVAGGQDRACLPHCQGVHRLLQRELEPREDGSGSTAGCLPSPGLHSCAGENPLLAC